jgi:hypothetical protein
MVRTRSGQTHSRPRAMSSGRVMMPGTSRRISSDPPWAPRR